ncbi:DUF2953 domain-containing protein [Paenibacillus lentus]|uniref:DUF2953 domain-containing protein n=1 Tax=Paenibacillus lentus TaxID=1338368 RepID=A0A3S8RVC9_9BACL|nr:DUF2953 domain-containing protein [Paenibacillus lentus]AZK47135.1 DUF2953 domain-containing protein [Paenibacillus lentus]
MWIWLGVILILLLVIIAVVIILLSPIKFHLVVRKVKQNEAVQLEVTMLYGVIRLRYEIPSIIFKNMKDGFKVEQQSSSNLLKSRTASSEQDINKDKIRSWVDQFYDLLQATKGLKKWTASTLKHISFHRLDWSTNVALSDAAYTATLSGALWGLKTTLIGGLSCYIDLKQRPRLFVVPVFDKPPLFATEMEINGEIRCVRALHAGFVLIVRVLKIKGGFQKWLSIAARGQKKGSSRS